MSDHQKEIPVFDQSIGEALIDSARISVMGALHFLPEEPSRILLPSDSTPPSVRDCLAEAMAWLDAARALSIEQMAAPPTSLHVVKGAT